jgi:hypothetical protein
MNVDISNALQILYPFTHKHMKAIIFRKVVIVYQQAVILTKDMMSYLHNICVNTLILSENEIVAFERELMLKDGIGTRSIYKSTKLRSSPK